MDELQDRIAVMLGGRAGEMVQFHTISTGASDDIQRATDLARRMVAEFGMSQKLGSVRYAGQQLQYLGGAVEDGSQISPETREVIDKEVQRIVTEQYERAQEILKGHRAFNRYSARFRPAPIMFSRNNRKWLRSRQAGRYKFTIKQGESQWKR